MNTDRLREAIACCAALDPNDDLGTEKCWKDITDMLVGDLPATINFIRLDCTDEEFYWLSPVFENVAEKSRSAEFIRSLRERLAKVKPETYRQETFKTDHLQEWVDYGEYVRSVEEEIAYAEGRLEGETPQALNK